jgi:hypothetical protein
MDFFASLKIPKSKDSWRQRKEVVMNLACRGEMARRFKTFGYGLAQTFSKENAPFLIARFQTDMLNLALSNYSR